MTPKYVVRIMQDLTACDTFHENDPGPTSRIIHENFCETKEEAMRVYETAKSANRFAGLAGQYVCYPQELK